MTYFPYSFSLMTRLEKSESPESRMKVPISGRVKTNSRASIARRISVAFFFEEPYAGAKMRSIDASDSGTMYCGYRRQSAYARWTATLPLMMSDERSVRSSFPRSERTPIVTLSKSMSSAALGAWTNGAAREWLTAIAPGPRWMRAPCVRDAGLEAGLRGWRPFMNFSAGCALCASRDRLSHTNFEPSQPLAHLPPSAEKRGHPTGRGGVLRRL